MTRDQIKKGLAIERQIKILNALADEFRNEKKRIKDSELETMISIQNNIPLSLYHNFALPFYSHCIEKIEEEIAKKEKELTDL